MCKTTKNIVTDYFRYADKLKSENTAGDVTYFNHPFLQACGMFLGEMMCMLAFYVVRFYKKKRREQRAAISSGIEGQLRARFHLNSISCPS